MFFCPGSLAESREMMGDYPRAWLSRVGAIVSP